MSDAITRAIDALIDEAEERGSLYQSWRHSDGELCELRDQDLKIDAARAALLAQFEKLEDQWVSAQLERDENYLRAFDAERRYEPERIARLEDLAEAATAWRENPHRRDVRTSLQCAVDEFTALDAHDAARKPTEDDDANGHDH